MTVSGHGDSEFLQVKLNEETTRWFKHKLIIMCNRNVMPSGKDGEVSSIDGRKARSSTEDCSDGAS